MSLSLEQIAFCLHMGETYAPRAITGVAIDSREVVPGNLFVCLPGEKADGHDFAAKAQEQGCAAVLASRPLPGLAVPVLVVADTARAMADLATWWRAESRAVVVCITGTAGKTTLKDTLASIMAQKGTVSCTRGNHNNQLGLPLTILNASGEEDFWVLELGINHDGDMDYLAAIARPDLALILNVGPGHTEGLGEKGVAWHKSRILKYLSPRGRALINGDNEDLVRACADTGVTPALFACHGHGAYRLLASRPGWQRVCVAGEEYAFETPFMGEAGAETALAAFAGAHMLGANGAQIAAGFAQARLPAHRFQHWQKGAMHIFDDTYNANPLSMERSLAEAGDFARSRHLPLYLLLGEMGELGAEAPHWHELLGRSIAPLNPTAVFWKGRYFQEMGKGLVACGWEGKVQPVSEGFTQMFLAMSAKDRQSGFVLLAKGSRVNGLEKQVELLQSLLAEEEHAL